MRKKLLSVLLTIAMLFSVLPAGLGLSAGAREDVNLALLPGVIASADSSENDSLTADKAIDGDTTSRTSRWSSENNWEDNHHWLALRFPQAVEANSVKIVWERANVENYVLEYSEDGSVWEPIQAFTQRPAELTQTVAFGQTITMQYIRLRTEKMCVDPEVDVLFQYYQNASLFEFEVYGQRKTTETQILNVARLDGVKATSDSSENDSLTADKAIDGNLTDRASRWSSENNWEDNNHWLQLEFPETIRLHSASIYWERANVEVYALEYSQDGEDWQTIRRFTEMPAALQQDVVFDEVVSARFIRLRTEKMCVDPEVDVLFQYYQNASLFEFEVYGEQEVEVQRGINLSLLNGVVATSDSVEKDTLTPDLAIDGDTSYQSRWSSANDWENNNHWLQLEFPQTVTAYSVTIYWEKVNAEVYAIEYSMDGEDWKPIRSFTEIPSALKQDILFDRDTELRYIRLRTEKMCVDGNVDIYFPYHQNVSVCEFEVYGEDPFAALKQVAAQLEAPVIATADDGSRSLTVPEVPQGYTLEFMGADYEQVIGDDGTVYDNIQDKTVTVGYRVYKEGQWAESPAFALEVPAVGNAGAGGSNAKPAVIPELAEWRGGEDNFAAADGARIVVNPADAEALGTAASEFARDYQEITGMRAAVVEGGETDLQPRDIYLALTASGGGLDKEGYLCTIADRIALVGEDPVGVYWGTRTLLQILKQTGGTIPQGVIRDYPKYEVRGFGIDVGRQTISLATLEEIAKNMAWYKMNDLHVHLNDNEILGYSGKVDSVENALTAYSGFRLESSIQNDEGKKLTNEDMFYTKDGFRDFIQSFRALGMNIVPEIDTPAHSLAITKVFPEYAFTFDPSAVDQVDLSKPGAVELMKRIFEEYLEGDDPVFDLDTTVHIGMDEYYGGGEGYRQYANELLGLLNGRTARVWGSLSRMAGSTKVPPENVQLNIWHTMWANPQQMYNEGYGLINSQNGSLYIIPGGGWDYLENEDIYRNWTPNLFRDSEKEGVTYNIPAYSKQMLGGSYTMWHDVSGNLDYGLSEYDSFVRFFHSLPILSEKLWAEGQDKSYDELTALAARMDTAPNSNPFYKVESKSEVVLRYGFEEETAQDHSGNGYHLLDGGARTEGYRGYGLALNDGAGYASTPLELLGPDYTVSFWVKRDADSGDNEQVLFEAEVPSEGPGFDGKVQLYQFKAVQKGTGKMGFSRENYDYSFDYTLPKGEWVYLTVEGKQDITKLYANGKLVSSLGSSDTWSLYATLPFPLQRIGAADGGFDGVIDELTVTDGSLPAVADKTALQQKLAEAKAIGAAGYTQQSYERLQTVIRDAEAVMEAVDALQTEVHQMADTLQAAIDGLEELPPLVITGAPESGSTRGAVMLMAEKEVTWTVNGVEVERASTTIQFRDEGTYTVTARADGAVSETIVFSIDRTAPVLTASVEHYGITNQDVHFNADEEVTFYNGSEIISEGTELTLTESGTYNIRAIDKAGNYTAFYRVTIMKEAPVLTGAPEGVTRSNITIRSNVKVLFIVNGVEADDYAYGLRVLEEGKYTVKAVDMAGNESEVSFEIDRTKPTFTASVPSGQATGKDITLTANEVVDFVIDGVTVATGTEYTISRSGLTVVRIYDVAGNYGGVYKANIDKSAPVLSAVVEGTNKAVENGATVKQNVTVKTSKPSYFIVNDGEPTARANFVKLKASGTYTVKAVDMLGNVSEVFTVTIAK